jgi:hypothetical protein
MLLIYRDESVYGKLSEQERGAIFREATEFSEAFRPSGFYQGGEPLEPVRTATTVRIKGGKPLITDGPFAETKEQLAGYTVLDAENLDEVLDFVAKNPLAQAGYSVEVRPIRVGGPK